MKAGVMSLLLILLSLVPSQKLECANESTRGLLNADSDSVELGET